MKKSLILASVLVTSLAVVPVGAQDAGEPATPAAKPAPAKRPPIYDEAVDAEKQIAAAITRAKKENRRVLIQWGANWCGWCHLLHDTFTTNADVKKKLLYEYDVVLVDIGRFDKHMDLAIKYGADLTKNGVPFLTILDSDGKPLANQETGSLEAKSADGKNGHDPKKVLDFLAANQAAPVAAGQLLREGLDSAKKADKQVFLHFGAPWCGWCHRLENWMARPDVAAILAKDFVDVKIDVDRNTGAGELVNQYTKSARTGIPWFAVLDKDGAAVVTSDGPDGNVGFPAKTEEIAHFTSMMKKVRKSMTEADIAALEASLTETQKPKSDGH